MAVRNIAAQAAQVFDRVGPRGGPGFLAQWMRDNIQRVTPQMIRDLQNHVDVVNGVPALQSVLNVVRAQGDQGVLNVIQQFADVNEPVSKLRRAAEIGQTLYNGVTGVGPFVAKHSSKIVSTVGLVLVLMVAAEHFGLGIPEGTTEKFLNWVKGLVEKPAKDAKPGDDNVDNERREIAYKSRKAFQEVVRQWDIRRLDLIEYAKTAVNQYEAQKLKQETEKFKRETQELREFRKQLNEQIKNLTGSSFSQFEIPDIVVDASDMSDTQKQAEADEEEIVKEEIVEEFTPTTTAVEPEVAKAEEVAAGNDLAKTDPLLFYHLNRDIDSKISKTKKKKKNVNPTQMRIKKAVKAGRPKAPVRPEKKVVAVCTAAGKADKGKDSNKWRDHVRAYAKAHDLNYFQALKKARKSYKP